MPTFAVARIRNHFVFEPIGSATAKSADYVRIAWHCIQPDMAMQNDFIDSFDVGRRDELLKETLSLTASDLGGGTVTAIRGPDAASA